MTDPRASSNVIAFPQPCRQPAPRAHGPFGPVRKGGLAGAIALRLSQTGQVRFAGTTKRPDLPDGSVSPLY